MRCFRSGATSPTRPINLWGHPNMKLLRFVLFPTILRHSVPIRFAHWSSTNSRCSSKSPGSTPISNPHSDNVSSSSNAPNTSLSVSMKRPST
eukprot:676052-Pyramimonas_sp.AAC.2